MQAKRYLQQAGTLEAQVDSRLKQLARLQEKQRLAETIDAVSPEARERMRVLEQEISADVQRWVDQERQARAAIGKLEQENHRLVLEYRYLCGWDWNRIARKMRYSVDWIMHVHANALRELQRQVQPGTGRKGAKRQRHG